MTAQRNWGRDVERDAWGGMAQDWTPRFRVMQGFGSVTAKTQNVRRARELAVSGSGSSTAEPRAERIASERREAVGSIQSA